MAQLVKDCKAQEVKVLEANRCILEARESCLTAHSDPAVSTLKVHPASCSALFGLLQASVVWPLLLALVPTRPLSGEVCVTVAFSAAAQVLVI